MTDVQHGLAGSGAAVAVLPSIRWSDGKYSGLSCKPGASREGGCGNGRVVDMRRCLQTPYPKRRGGIEGQRFTLCPQIYAEKNGKHTQPPVSLRCVSSRWQRLRMHITRLLLISAARHLLPLGKHATPQCWRWARSVITPRLAPQIYPAAAASCCGASSSRSAAPPFPTLTAWRATRCASRWAAGLGVWGWLGWGWGGVGWGHCPCCSLAGPPAEPGAGPSSAQALAPLSAVNYSNTARPAALGADSLGG